MSDLEILGELEEKLNVKFEKVNTNLERTNTWETVGYKLNEKRQVIGLFLYDLNLKDIPNNILKLKKLKELNLRVNLIKNIECLKELKNLQLLDLSSNQISDITILKELKNLQLLDLSWNNQIKNFSILKELKNLQTLNLTLNNIEDIIILKELKKLQELDLNYNHIKNIPYELAKTFNFNIVNEIFFLNKNAINIYNNPIESPPLEIIEEGRESIENYYKSIRKKIKPLNEVKLLLVGDGGAGKTSLVKRIINNDFDLNESQTHGININIWKVNENDRDISVRIWDFGGQEIMHATHQFFLSKRSLYILVLDGRKGENPEYWLKYIQTFGVDSKVLIVLNKIDEHPSFDVNRNFLKEKYPNIIEFYKLSCKEDEGVKEFAKRLKSELSKVEMISTLWGKSWFDVKSYLESHTRDYITLDEYHNICIDNEIDEKSMQKTLIDFLNDLGIILHFSDFELDDTQVLNPSWVTEAVYKIINAGLVAKANGILKLEMLEEILKPKDENDYSYPKDKHKFIINIMKKFELCYSLDNETILIPDLLEVNEPIFEFDYDSSLKFVFTYDFLPRLIMPRFIVNIHRDIKDKLRWRSGVVIESKEFNSIAVIKSDIEDRKIFIYVNGENRQDYFAYIRKTIENINNSFKKLKYDLRVVIEKDITVSYSHLLKLESKNKKTIFPENADKEYNVKELLGRVGVISDIKENEEESKIDLFNKTVQLKPSFFGIGLNINEVIDRVFKKKIKK